MMMHFQTSVVYKALVHAVMEKKTSARHKDNEK